MSGVMNDSKSMAHYIRNCQEMGIEVLPPDINRSGKKFTVENGKIRFGLLAIKNLGEAAIDSIIEARNQKGCPQDIFRFIDNIDIHKVNKKAVESLIKSDAMDCLNENRAAHMGIYESLMDSAQSSARHNIDGQISLFQTNAESMEAGASNTLPDVKNFDNFTLTAQEKEMLGVYLTSHPLDEYAEIIENNVTVTSQDLALTADSEEEGMIVSNVRDGMNAVMAGIVTGKKTLITKNGKMMAFVEMEDMYGPVEIVVFPNVYEKSSALIDEDSIISVKGTINFKEGETPKILANEIVDLRQLESLRAEEAPEPSRPRRPEPRPQPAAQERPASPPAAAPAAPERPQPVAETPEGLFKIRLPEGDGIHNIDAQNENMLAKLSAVMRKYPGRWQGIIYYPQGGSRRTGPELWAEPTDDFAREIKEIVGEENFKI